MTRIVLVADDSPTIQKRALGILKGEGFEVETVSNGVAAIKRLGLLHPSVVLADISMPGRDGYEVCEFVKNSPEFSHVPVLLIASEMELYDRARGAEVRADGIIKKPFEAHELISIVERLAEKYEAAMPTLAEPPVPLAGRVPTPEFAISSGEVNDAPAAVQQEAPDFDGVPEGVAFSEPVMEEGAGYSPTSQSTGMEVSCSAPQSEAEIASELAAAMESAPTVSASELQSAPAEETPFVAEALLPPGFFAPLSPPVAEAPSSLEPLEAPAPEPLFIEEAAAAPISEPASAPPVTQTSTFSAPLEIADPVWNDETVPAPAEPEPASSHELEPQPAAEATVVSPEVPVDHVSEPSPTRSFLTPSDFDSFSLEDAAGQVPFASETPEAVPAKAVPVEGAPDILWSAPLEETPATVIALSEPAPEVASAEFALAESALEPSSAEPLPEVAAAEAPSTEPLAELAAEEPIPAEPFAEVAVPEPPFAEPSPELVVVEPIPAEPFAEAGVPELPSTEPLAEVAKEEPTPAEPFAEVAVPEPPSVEPSPEIATEEPTPAEPFAEVSVPEPSAAEPSPELVAAESSPAEPLTEVATSPAFDRDLIRSVVHKTVLRMSPPVLPAEAVEEIARRLADEMIAELSSESSPPQA